MAVPPLYIFSTVPGGTSIPLSELDENFNYLATSPTLTSLTLSGNSIVNGSSTVAGLLTANGGLSLTGALNLNGSAGSNNQVVYSNSGTPSWSFINPSMMTTGAPSWDSSGNLTAAGQITSGIGTFKSGAAPLSQLILGSNNFTVFLNSLNCFNVTGSSVTIPNNLLVTGSSSTFNGSVNALANLTLSGSFTVNGSAGSSNSVLLISGSTPTWGKVSPSSLTTGGPTWDGSGNVSATLGFGAGNGTFYNSSAANCNLALTTTGAITSINGSSVFSVTNSGNATVLNNLTVGGGITSSGGINATGGLAVGGNVTAVGTITSTGSITSSSTLQGTTLISTTGVFKGSSTTPNMTLSGSTIAFNTSGANGATINSTGNFQLNPGATSYNILANSGFTGQLGINFGLSPSIGSYLYNMGSNQLEMQCGGNTTIIDSNGNITTDGKVASGTGVFAAGTTTSNSITLQTTNATIAVNGTNTVVSTAIGTAITGYVASTTGNFINSTSSATSQLAVNTTAFTATVNGVAVSQILANGNMTITGLLTQLSDKSLKTNIENISKSDAIEKVRKLQGVLYNMKNDPEGPKYLGLIADDVEPIVPEVIIEADISAEQDGSRKVKSIAYANLVSILIEAVKEIDDRLTAKGI